MCYLCSVPVKGWMVLSRPRTTAAVRQPGEARLGLWWRGREVPKQWQSEGRTRVVRRAGGQQSPGQVACLAHGEAQRWVKGTERDGEWR